MYLLSPHLSVAEIEPTYLIYPSDVGDRVRPHIEWTRGQRVLCCQLDLVINAVAVRRQDVSPSLRSELELR